MRFGSSNSWLQIVLQAMLVSILLMLTNAACAQSEAARIKESRQHEAKALELRQGGNLENALKEQQKAVELNPNDSKPLTILAGIARQISREQNKPEYLQQSKEALEKAITLNDKDAVAHEMLADVLDLSGDKERALAEQKEAARLEPQNLNYLTNVGLMQNELYQIEEARETYRSVLAKDPKFIYALYQFGVFEEQEGNVVRATEFYESALRAQPKESGDKLYQEDVQKRLGELKAKNK